MKKQNIKKQKTGKEIVDLYNELNKAGFTPEEGMLYLLMHMQKIKAQEIGMDLVDPSGKTMSVTLKINGGNDDQYHEVPLVKGKYDLAAVV